MVNPKKSTVKTQQQFWVVVNPKKKIEKGDWKIWKKKIKTLQQSSEIFGLLLILEEDVWRYGVLLLCVVVAKRGEKRRKGLSLLEKRRKKKWKNKNKEE